MQEAAQTVSTNDPAGRDAPLAGFKTDTQTILDVAANYQLTQQTRLYLKLDNVLDEADIVSRRPFGARPGKPRQALIGLKYEF